MNLGNKTMSLKSTTSLFSDISNIKRIFTIREVQLIAGNKSRATIYRWIKNGSFPASIHIGGNSVGWPEEVICEWRISVLNGGAA